MHTQHDPLQIKRLNAMSVLHHHHQSIIIIPMPTPTNPTPINPGTNPAGAIFFTVEILVTPAVEDESVPDAVSFPLAVEFPDELELEEEVELGTITDDWGRVAAAKIGWVPIWPEPIVIIYSRQFLVSTKAI